MQLLLSFLLLTFTGTSASLFRGTVNKTLINEDSKGTYNTTTDTSNNATAFSFENDTLVQMPRANDDILVQITMNDRDRGYLAAHNTRRKLWHTRYNKTFVPLEWDNDLKAQAKVWAEHLLGNCGKGMYHDPSLSGYGYGETATANMGSGIWGSLYSPNDIVRRYVEREEKWSPPANNHLTQVLWRSTKYVGCAEASKSMGGNIMCHTSVVSSHNLSPSSLFVVDFFVTMKLIKRTSYILPPLISADMPDLVIAICRNTRVRRRIGGLSPCFWPKVMSVVQNALPKVVIR